MRVVEEGEKVSNTSFVGAVVTVMDMIAVHLRNQNPSCSEVVKLQVLE
jgi:hypothetical protein